MFPGSFKLLVSFFENILVFAVQFVHRGDIAGGTVGPDVVVLFDVLCHKSPGIVKLKWCFGPDTFSFECFVKPFELAVRLWVIGRRPYVRHPGQSDKLLEVLGDELRPIV